MKSNVLICGIICITALEALAISKGINGILLTSVIGVIAAAIGLTFPKPKFLRIE